MPPFPLVRCQAAENQTVSGVRVPWKIVPAVADTRRSQPAQRHRRSGAAPSPIRCPSALGRATPRAYEALRPAQPVEVVQALPVLIEPGAELGIGVRIVPTSQ